jgi:hypothetical protein
MSGDYGMAAEPIGQKKNTKGRMEFGPSTIETFDATKINKEKGPVYIGPSTIETFDATKIGKKKEPKEQPAQAAASPLGVSAESRNWRAPSSRAAQALVPSSSATGSSVARKTLLGQ